MIAHGHFIIIGETLMFDVSDAATQARPPTTSPTSLVLSPA